MVEDNPIKNGRATGIVQVNINTNRSLLDLLRKLPKNHLLTHFLLNLVGFHVADSGVAEGSGILPPD